MKRIDLKAALLAIIAVELAVGLWLLVDVRESVSALDYTLDVRVSNY